MKPRTQSALLALFALAASPVSAPAQDYPSRAVTIVAPAAPGGLYSLFARLIGSKLEQRLGKPFVVENRAGRKLDRRRHVGDPRPARRLYADGGQHQRSRDQY
jgi:hypothetical protein